MAQTLHQQLAEVGSRALLATQGETAIFTPLGGSPVTTKAVINRQPLLPTPRGGQPHLQYTLEALLPRSVATALNVNGDTLAVPRRVGDASNVTYTIAAILNQDGALWKVALR